MHVSKHKVLAETEVGNEQGLAQFIKYLTIFQKELIWKQIPLTVLEAQRKIPLYF